MYPQSNMDCKKEEGCCRHRSSLTFTISCTRQSVCAWVSLKAETLRQRDLLHLLAVATQFTCALKPGARAEGRDDPTSAALADGPTGAPRAADSVGDMVHADVAR